MALHDRLPDRGSTVLACLVAVAGALLLTEIALRLVPGLFPAIAGDFLPAAAQPGRPHGVALIYEDEMGFRPSPHRRLRYRRTWDLVRAGDVAASYAPRDTAMIELRTDHQGFRNPPGLDHADIVVVGDSFVQSVLIPYEETWTSVLAQESGREVHNLGVAGYGPQQVLRVIERYALRRRPKVVVLSIFEGNDVHDAAFFEQVRRSGLRWDHFEHLLGRAGQPTESWRRIERSRTLAGLRYLVEELRGRPRRSPATNTFNPVCAGETCMAFGDVLLYRETLSREHWEAHDGWRRTTEALRAARDLVHGAGAELMVVLVPSKARVYLPHLEGSYSTQAFESYVEATAKKYGGKAYGDTAGTANWQERFQCHSGSLNRLLRGWLARAGIPYVDLWPALSSAAAERRLVYFPFDSHWNPQGNRLVGELMAKRLSRPSYPES